MGLSRALVGLGPSLREGSEDRFLTDREWKELHAFVEEHGGTELVDFHGPLGGEEEE